MTSMTFSHGDRDRFINSLAELPEKFVPTPLRPLLHKRAELLTTSAELGERVLELMHGTTYSDAQAKDREAAATAVLAGEPTPTNVHTAQVQHDLNQTAADQRATSAALDLLAEQILPLLAEHASQVTVEVEANQAAALKQWRSAVTALVKAANQVRIADGAAHSIAGALDTEPTLTLPAHAHRGMSTQRLDDIYDLLTDLAAQ